MLILDDPGTYPARLEHDLQKTLDGYGPCFVDGGRLRYPATV